MQAMKFRRIFASINQNSGKHIIIFNPTKMLSSAVFSTCRQYAWRNTWL